LLAERFDIVFFQKVRGPSVERLARQLSAAGVRTVYGVCDLVDAGMAMATDCTIAVTNYLKSLYPPALQSKIRVVHDGIEHVEICKTSWRTDRGSRSNPLRAVLVTSEHLDRLPVIEAPPEWLEVTIVGLYPPAGQALQRLRYARWKLAAQKYAQERVAYLRFLANRRIRCLAWDPVGVYDTLRQADIGIIPVQMSPQQEPVSSVPPWKVKSENRLTMKMCMGLPVTATPIPSYEAVVRHGENGLLAHSQRDWLDCLSRLRDSDLRREMGTKARQSVIDRYSLDAQAELLTAVLRSVISK
jgi:glycosyltransferase involved in cell wall biosynthesis